MSLRKEILYFLSAFCLVLTSSCVTKIQKEDFLSDVDEFKTTKNLDGQISVIDESTSWPLNYWSELTERRVELIVRDFGGKFNKTDKNLLQFRYLPCEKKSEWPFNNNLGNNLISAGSLTLFPVEATYRCQVGLEVIESKSKKIIFSDTSDFYITKKIGFIYTFKIVIPRSEYDETHIAMLPLRHLLKAYYRNQEKLTQNEHLPGAN